MMWCCTPEPTRSDGRPNAIQHEPRRLGHRRSRRYSAQRSRIRSVSLFTGTNMREAVNDGRAETRSVELETKFPLKALFAGAPDAALALFGSAPQFDVPFG